ncbi:MAG: hypothetical protein JWP72_2394, partial [Massilia sp.]|nr:hypothetical protein [Massilia sp.]
YLPPAGLNTLLNSELVYWRNVITKANIQLD